MLKSLSIQNIALIDKLDVEFNSGLNILSGETGAGKSIIIDSVGFVLGERADKSLIRFGTDFATVEAVFDDYVTPSVRDYMFEMGIDEDDVLIIRRKMTLDGKNECRINGRLTNLSTLKGLTNLLVDVHGQHEHQSLLNPSTHQGLIDALGGDEIADRLRVVSDLHSQYVSLKKEFNSLGDSDERLRRLDILEYQLAEIKKADVKEGEEDELLDKRKRVRNIEKILSALGDARNLLDGYDQHAVSTSLKSSISSLDGITAFDTRIAGYVERLEDAKAEVVDVAECVKDLLDEFDFDKRSADEIEERLEIVRSLQRKYGGSYQAMINFYQSASEEYDRLSNAGERVDQLNKLLSTVGDKLSRECAQLSKLRVDTAKKFENDILNELKDLGMGGSTFAVSIETTDSVDKMTAKGADDIEFLISPNVGEPLKPLAKIISGGEMSRFMLALKNILAGLDEIDTMIFDEIDTGISGKIEQAVAHKMCNISLNRQVIAVTHMAVLAAQADHHYLISKYTADGKTKTSLDKLDDNVNEIVRLICGREFDHVAEPLAKELIADAKEYKASLGKR